MSPMHVTLKAGVNFEIRPLSAIFQTVVEFEDLLFWHNFICQILRVGANTVMIKNIV